LRALIVDDEPLARARLARLLRVEGGVEVIGEAGDGEAALARIRELWPDIVFLDIRMPGLDGLAVASADEPLPAIVFTTAHQEHAVEAFELDAVDYLLKPVQKERLTRALLRVRARSQAENPPPAGRGSRPRRLCVQEGGAFHVFETRGITRFHAADKYTVFVCDGREHLIEESLSTLESKLSGHGFFRAHRSELLNLDHVRSVASDEDGGVVIMSDGQRAKVSRRHAAALKRALAGR